MRGKKVGQQSFQAGFSEFSSQVRKLEQIVEIVDGIAERPYVAQLLFRSFQMLLDLGEMGETLFDVLIELLLYLSGDVIEFAVNLAADCFK